jgi:hypothetical protein
VRFALTDEKYAELSAAARQAGLARGAYAAEATLAIARGSPDLALAIRPRYADHRHLGHADPPADPDGPASHFADLEAGSLRARLYGRA